jgi:hypothetical protein
MWHHYLKIKDMVHITIKVEKQLEKKNIVQNQPVIWDAFRVESRI